MTEEKIVHAAISATTHTAEQTARAQSGWSRFSPLHRGRLRPRRHPRGGDRRPRRLRPARRTAATSRTSTSRPSCSPARRSASSRWARRSPCCSAASTSPSVRSPASSSSSASFFVLDGKSTAVWVLGFGVMLVVAVAVGLLNGALIRFAKFTPVAATLVHVHRARRPGLHAARCAGRLHRRVRDRAHLHEGRPGADRVHRLRPRAPSALELMLRKSRFGLRLRAVGSDEESARRVGVPINRTRCSATSAPRCSRSSARSSCSRSSASATRGRARATRSPRSPPSCSAARACSAGAERSSGR